MQQTITRFPHDEISASRLALIRARETARSEAAERYRSAERRRERSLLACVLSLLAILAALVWGIAP